MMEIMEGSHAVAHAVKLSRPQVIAAYPITPQTHIVEALADMVADCHLDAEYITVESEFSALSACLGASAAGSRVYSATTSQGLALMFEVCYNVAGMRLPIVMTIVNRSLGAPLSIWNDQQDSISLRDSGWLQYYAQDNQEATDLHYIAYKVAEDHDILLPAFVCLDGFILSHTYEPVDMLTQEQVDSFLPAFSPYQRLDADDPVRLRDVRNSRVLHGVPLRSRPGHEAVNESILCGREGICGALRERLQCACGELPSGRCRYRAGGHGVDLRHRKGRRG